MFGWPGKLFSPNTVLYKCEGLVYTGAVYMIMYCLTVLFQSLCLPSLLLYYSPSRESDHWAALPASAQSREQLTQDLGHSDSSHSPLFFRYYFLLIFFLFPSFLLTLNVFSSDHLFSELVMLPAQLSSSQGYSSQASFQQCIMSEL